MKNNIFFRIARPMYRFTLKTLASFFYREYSDYLDHLQLLKFAFFQKILGFNRKIPWPVHFTSTITEWKKIKKGRKTNPGDSPGCYIQSANGIIFGSNVWIGPNVAIVSTNHNIDDYDKYQETEPIEIGNDVWIGANSVVLPGIKIGNNVIIGAGSIVTHNIPDNCIAAGNPCRIMLDKPPYKGKNL